MGSSKQPARQAKLDLSPSSPEGERGRLRAYALITLATTYERDENQLEWHRAIIGTITETIDGARLNDVSMSAALLYNLSLAAGMAIEMAAQLLQQVAALQGQPPPPLDEAVDSLLQNLLAQLDQDAAKRPERPT